MVDHSLVGQVPGGLAGNALPRLAAVGAAVDGVLLVRDADVDARRGVARRAARLVKHDPDHARAVAEVAVGVVRVLGVVADVREVGHPRPGDSEVGAAPQSVPLGRTKVDDAVAVGVNGESLTHTTARHVATELERELGPLPCISAVLGAQDRAVVGVPVVGVHTDRGVNPVGIHRVRRDAVHTVPTPLVPANPVKQGNP